MALDALSRPLATADPRRVVTLHSPRWQVDVLPGTGAALAAGRIRTADGVWRDLLRPTPRARLADPERCASFPMLPWSNRIDAGLLPFDGRTWQLQRNGSDGTAIHGALRTAPWRVAALSAESVVLEADAADLVGVNFPWRFAARVGYALRGDALEVTTSLRNADAEPFPAGFGHHPYFLRTLAPTQALAPSRSPRGPISRTGAPRSGDGTVPAGPVLAVGATAGYVLRRGVATGPAGPVPARADFRTARPVGAVHVDDVLTARTPGPLATLRYDEPGVTVTIDADDAYSHVVVYAPRGRGHVAIEPVTHVNGGFALHAAGVAGTGVVVLAPGDELAAAFRVTVSV